MIKLPCTMQTRGYYLARWKRLAGMHALHTAIQAGEPKIALQKKLKAFCLIRQSSKSKQDRNSPQQKCFDKLLPLLNIYLYFVTVHELQNGPLPIDSW